eukprot:evm.model.scf_885.1 EVM.evm.TU.scf_885.1   scf_885:144-5811(-)
MAAYFQYLSFSMELHANVSDVTFSPVYGDFGGLGDMTTVVCPVFVSPKCSNGSESSERLLLGVVGKDVTLEMLEEEGLRRDELEQKIDENLGKARQCRQHYHYSNCKMQALRKFRARRPSQAQCPASRWTASDPDKCYKFKSKVYLLVGEAVKFEAALQRCSDLGGRLAELGPADPYEQQHFLASIVPPDGAWIGLQPVGRDWVWVGSQRQAQGERMWIAEPLKNTLCRGGFVDPRGIEFNVGARKCQEKTAFVCEFNSTAKDLPPECQGNTTVVSPEELNATTAEGCLGSQACAVATDNLQVPDQLRSKVICKAKEHRPKQYNELVCCAPQDLPEVCLTKEQALANTSSTPQKTDTSSSGNSSQIAALAAAIAIVGVVFLALTAMLAAEAKSPGAFQRAYEGM